MSAAGLLSQAEKERLVREFGFDVKASGYVMAGSVVLDAVGGVAAKARAAQLLAVFRLSLHEAVLFPAAAAAVGGRGGGGWAIVPPQRQGAAPPTPAPPRPAVLLSLVLFLLQAGLVLCGTKEQGGGRLTASLLKAPLMVICVVYGATRRWPSLFLALASDGSGGVFPFLIPTFDKRCPREQRVGPFWALLTASWRWLRRRQEKDAAAVSSVFFRVDCYAVVFPPFVRLRVGARGGFLATLIDAFLVRPLPPRPVPGAGGAHLRRGVAAEVPVALQAWVAAGAAANSIVRFKPPNATAAQLSVLGLGGGAAQQQGQPQQPAALAPAARPRIGHWLGLPSYLQFLRAGGGAPGAQAARFIACAMKHSLGLVPYAPANSVPLRHACAVDPLNTKVNLDMDMLCFDTVVTPPAAAGCGLAAVLLRALGPQATVLDTEDSLSSAEFMAVLDSIDAHVAQLRAHGVVTGAPSHLAFTKHDFFSEPTGRAVGNMVHALPPQRLISALFAGAC